MPSNSSPPPSGIWIGTALALKRARIISTTRAKSAPTRSILLTKAMRGTPYLSAWRHTVSDCGSTPPTAQNTATDGIRFVKSSKGSESDSGSGGLPGYYLPITVSCTLDVE